MTTQTLQNLGLAMGQTPNSDTSMSGMNPLGMGTFDQTLNSVPQDLWRMPMTLEWDWGDMTGYSGYEDGISMNGVLPDFNQNSGHGTSGMNMNAMNGNANGHR
jgi:hypothetical protein